MADILLSPVLHQILLAGGLVFTLLAVHRQRILWAILASVCTICTCLLGLAAERSLEQLLIAVLIPMMIILLSQTSKEGGSNE